MTTTNQMRLLYLIEFVILMGIAALIWFTPGYKPEPSFAERAWEHCSKMTEEQHYCYEVSLQTRTLAVPIEEAP
jgi:transposase